MPVDSAARSDTFEVLARWGWISKGVVHGTVGVLALMWALGDAREGETTDLQGALGAIGSGPLATVLLGVTALGLAAYSLWRFAQAYYDVDGEGSDLHGTLRRVSYAGIGVAYAVLTFTAASALFGRGDGPDGEADYTGWTALALDLPAGPWLVGAAGVFVMGAGVFQLVRAYRARFLKGWRENSDHEVVHYWGAWVSRFGLAARAVVIAMLGWFIFRAAWRDDAREARNLGETLWEVAPEPWLLGLLAVGFIAFGVHCFLNACYRHINDCPEEEED